MSSKKLIYSIFLSIGLFSLLFICLNFFLYKTPASSLWIKNSFMKKEGYSRSIQSKKIIFASGSNTLYGIETNLIEKEFKIPVVNMAVHAGLKTNYILYKARKNLHNGDTVVVPFEYQNYMWDGEPDNIQVQYLLTNDRDYFFDELNLFEKINLLFSIRPNDLLKSVIEQISFKNKEHKIGVGYNSNTQNKNGDETYKAGTKRTLYTIKPMKIEHFYETKALKYIKNFSKWCKKNNIKLILAFPNTINYKEYYEEPYLTYFNNLESYFKKNKMKLIGHYTDSLYPVNYFYDTNYHMNNKGAKIRTHEFIQLLKDNRVVF